MMNVDYSSICLFVFKGGSIYSAFCKIYSSVSPWFSALIYTDLLLEFFFLPAASI